MNIFYKVTLESMKKNKNRTLVTIIGVILSTAMITAVTGMFSSVQSYMLSAASESYGTYHLAGMQLSKDKLFEVLEDKRVKSGAYYEEIGYALLNEDKTEKDSYNYKSYAYIAGFHQEAFEMFSISLLSGRMPENSGEILLPSHIFYDDSVDWGIGDRITLNVGHRVFEGGQEGPRPGDTVMEEEVLSQNNPISEDKEETLADVKAKEYTIVGVCNRPSFEDYSSPGYTMITLGEEDKDSTYCGAFTLKEPRDVYDFAEEVFSDNGVIFNQYLLQAMGISRNENFYRVVTGLSVILIGLIMFGSVFLIYNAFSISVSERTKQFGLLSSIGATRRQLRKSIGFEALLISGAGIPLGILSGVFGMGVTLGFVGDGISNYIFESENTSLRLSISLPAVCIAACIAFITVCISAWIPAVRAGKVSAIDAIRQTRDIQMKPKEVKTSGFLSKLFGLEGMLAGKNYKRNRKKYRSTVFSLSLSIILFIGASSFVSYLTKGVLTVFSIPDGDIYYEFWDMEEGPLIYEKLAKADYVTKSMDFTNILLHTGIYEEDFNKEYKERFNMDRFSDGRLPLTVRLAVLADEDFIQYAKKLGLSEKDYMNTDKPKGIGYAYSKYFDTEEQKYKEVFLFADEKEKTFDLFDISYTDVDGIGQIEEDTNSSIYGNNLSATADCFVNTVPKGYSLLGYNSSCVIFIPETQYDRLLKDYDMGQVTTAVFYSDNYNLSYENMKKILWDNEIYDTSSLYNARSEYEKDKTTALAVKILSAGFITLISLISAANVFNTIFTSIRLRRREFAMLKSVGMTGREFMKMMYYECLLLGLRAAVFGLPPAILVAISVYRVISGGVSMKFYFPLLSIALALAGVFLVIFLTMYFTVRGVKKENIVDMLKDENL